MATTTIEWTLQVLANGMIMPGRSWNLVTGCSHVSSGCDHCYAEVMARRLQAMGQPRYANGFQVTLHEEIMDLPLSWKQPSRIFVNS